MKRLVITAYVLLFWILLPLALLVAARVLDHKFDLAPALALRAMGIATLPVMVFLLALAIVQYRTQTRELPVSYYPAKTIARHGLYSVFRHPIYLFFTLTLYALALIWGSRSMLFIVMPLFACVVAVYIFFEERGLRRRFGGDYHAYQEQTGQVFPHFHVLLKPFFYLLSRFYFPITVKGRKNIPVRAPFFLAANHRNYLDPFLISYTLPYKVHYVTTFEMFRQPLTTLVFRWLGCIPKKRYLHDTGSVKEIIQTLKKGGVVGIFPEGERSYTGEPLELKPEPLKLFARFPEIPVLPVSVSGNYIMWPRWGKGWRRCPITVEYKPSLRIRKDMDHGSIRNAIAAAIRPDDSGRKSRCSKRAHDIQRLLYRCPACRHFDSLQPEGSDFHCASCGAHFFLTDEYRIADKRSNTTMSIGQFYESIRITPEEIRDDQQLIASSDDCRLFAETGTKFSFYSKGLLALLQDRIIIKNDRREMSFEIKNIMAATIEGVKKLQIYDLGRKQAFQLVFPDESARKWQDYFAGLYYRQFKKPLTTR